MQEPQNVTMTVEGDILTLKIDLRQEFGLSSTGKTITVASTRGSTSVPGHEEIKVGLNVFKKPR